MSLVNIPLRKLVTPGGIDAVFGQLKLAAAIGDHPTYRIKPSMAKVGGALHNKYISNKLKIILRICTKYMYNHTMAHTINKFGKFITNQEDFDLYYYHRGNVNPKDMSITMFFDNLGGKIHFGTWSTRSTIVDMHKKMCLMPHKSIELINKVFKIENTEDKLSMLEELASLYLHDIPVIKKMAVEITKSFKRAEDFSSSISDFRKYRWLTRISRGRDFNIIIKVFKPEELTKEIMDKNTKSWKKY